MALVGAAMQLRLIILYYRAVPAADRKNFAQQLDA
jgi:hypothetical protein